MSFEVFLLLVGQKFISASPLSSPGTTARMLDFAGRRRIEPIIETFPMDHRVNDTLAHLQSGKARYWIVLKH